VSGPEERFFRRGSIPTEWRSQEEIVPVQLDGEFTNVFQRPGIFADGVLEPLGEAMPLFIRLMNAAAYLALQVELPVTSSSTIRMSSSWERVRSPSSSDRMVNRSRARFWKRYLLYSQTSISQLFELQQELLARSSCSR